MFDARSIGRLALGVSFAMFAAPVSADDKPQAKPEAKAEAKPEAKAAAKKARRTPEQVLAKKDKNKDGAIELKEFLGKKKADTAAREAKFAKRDKDGDGKLSKAELTSGGKKKAKSAKKAKKAAKAKKTPAKA